MDLSFTLNPHQARSISLAATRSTPSQFAQWIHSKAKTIGLPANRILLGGDHLGPFPWRNEKAPQLRWRKLAAWFAIASPRAIRRFISTQAWVVLTIRGPQFPRR
jgi:hypothetical protein